MSHRSDLQFRHIVSKLTRQRFFGSYQMRTVFDPSFKYTRSLETDVRKTFERVRRQQRQARGREQATSQPETKVTVLKLEQFNKGKPQLGVG